MKIEEPQFKYRIHISYKTGDSESFCDAEHTLEVGWNDLAVAKENLQFIKQHYIMYRDLRWEEIKTREQWCEYAHDKFWFVNNNFDCIKLKLDNGNVFQMSCFWCGNFESLHSAEIIVDNSDMKIEFD